MRMQTMTFELVPAPAPYKGGLHEALCKAIHELDCEAINWLTDNVLSIEVKEQE